MSIASPSCGTIIKHGTDYLPSPVVPSLRTQDDESLRGGDWASIACQVFLVEGQAGRQQGTHRFTGRVRIRSRTGFVANFFIASGGWQRSTAASDTETDGETRSDEIPIPRLLNYGTM